MFDSLTKMEKEKKSFWKNLKNGFEKSEEEIHSIKLKSPLSYIIFWNLTVFLFILVLIGFMFLAYQSTKLIPFEMEGSCNTGFIGIDYKSIFVNQPYSTLINKGYYTAEDVLNVTRYIKEYLPKEFNLKNIDGLNCNFKVKGAIPLNIFKQI